MTTKQFIDKWLDKKADWDGAYGGQCVDLFRFYVNEVLNLSQPKSVIGAADFWANYDSDSILKDNFTRIKNTADFLPQEGDVMIWTRRVGDGFGHIAIVTDGSKDLEHFHSFDQNWFKISYCEVVKHNYTNVYGVLRPKKADDALASCLIDREKFWKERDEANNRSLLLEEQNGTIQTDLLESNSKLKQAQNRGLERLETLSKALNTDFHTGNTEDSWANVIAKAQTFKKVEEDRDEFKDKYDREVKARKEDYEKYQEELKGLRDEIAKMKTQLDNIDNRVDEKIENDVQPVEVIEPPVSRFQKLINKLLSIIRR